MLILTRMVDQGILIGGNIYVRVLGVGGDSVKLGISAPEDVKILKDEILDRDMRAKAGGAGREGGGGDAGDAPPQYADQALGLSGLGKSMGCSGLPSGYLCNRDGLGYSMLQEIGCY